jgi:hypothetical protein
MSVFGGDFIPQIGRDLRVRHVDLIGLEGLKFDGIGARVGRDVDQSQGHLEILVGILGDPEVRAGFRGDETRIFLAQEMIPDLDRGHVSSS